MKRKAARQDYSAVKTLTTKFFNCLPSFNPSLQQTRYTKFVHDKERKLLSFTGKFDNMEVPAKDLTGLDIPGKYVEKYSLECYDFTDPDHPSELSIWQRGIREACTVLYFLSKSKTILEVIRNNNYQRTIGCKKT